MKKFLLRIFLFLVLIVAFDCLLGVVCEELVKNSKKGSKIEKRLHVARYGEEDVLILGSSRALHHYDARLIADSLGMSVFNGGLSGKGIITAYGYFAMAAERHTPRLLVYEITPEYDYFPGDNFSYLEDLRLFYDDEVVKEIFSKVDAREKWKMWLQTYRYNSMLPQLLLDCTHPRHISVQGYRPFDGALSQEPPRPVLRTDLRTDSLKVHYLNRLIADCERLGIRLVFAVSPKYYSGDIANLCFIEHLCEHRGLPLLNHYADTAFVGHREFFKDGAHLNRVGATHYSRRIASELRMVLKAQ